MKRLFAVLFVTLLGLIAVAPAAVAGSPHFVNSAFTISREGDTLVVSGKEAGLGDETQITVVLSATALCINGGGNHPKAVNKADVSTATNVPVQNGKAEYTLRATATFQPSCSPPMTVRFTNVKVTDTTNGLEKSFPGTF
jgi:hypothetical protein